MSELSHEVGNGHRILTVPDFKLNFARREANQAGGHQHQTSRDRSLRLVTRTHNCCEMFIITDFKEVWMKKRRQRPTKTSLCMRFLKGE